MNSLEDSFKAILKKALVLDSALVFLSILFNGLLLFSASLQDGGNLGSGWGFVILSLAFNYAYPIFSAITLLIVTLMVVKRNLGIKILFGFLNALVVVLMEYSYLSIGSIIKDTSSFLFLTIFLLIVFFLGIIFLSKLKTTDQFFSPTLTLMIALYIVLIPFGIYGGVQQVNSKREQNEIRQAEISASHASVNIQKQVSSKIVKEDLINDPRNKYKLLRINVSLSVPESGDYTISADMTDKTSKQYAGEIDLNEKNLNTQANHINLQAGENILIFDFPYIAYNDLSKKDVVNLPFNDKVDGSYGPFRFLFYVTPYKTGSYDNDQYHQQGAYPQPIEFRSDTYVTKAYNYSDFYQK